MAHATARKIKRIAETKGRPRKKHRLAGKVPGSYFTKKLTDTRRNHAKEADEQSRAKGDAGRAPT